jgi:transposase-like protein
MKTELDSAPPDGVAAEIDASAQASAFASARMSGPRQRIEVITGAERRRRWSWEQKQAIVMESVALHASPTAIARKYGLNTGQLYTRRRQMLRRVLLSRRLVSPVSRWWRIWFRRHLSRLPRPRHNPV